MDPIATLVASERRKICCLYWELNHELSVIQTITFQNSDYTIPAVVQLVVHQYFAAEGKSMLAQCTTRYRLKIAFSIFLSVSLIVPG